MKKILVVLLFLFVSASVMAQDANAHMNHGEMAEPGQDWAKQQLAKSPRHQEWVPIKYGNRTVNTFVVYPEVKGKATAVLLIHEIFGLSDWAQEVADEFAA